MGLSPVLATDRVGFAAMTSPGVALLATILLTSMHWMTPALALTVLQRSWRPVLADTLFMTAARLLVECGTIAALAASLGGLGRVGATLTVVFLAAIGGFVTGSGVTGNALFMPSAAAAGTAIGALPILAALQNGVSGLVAMASLPVAAILLATLPGPSA
jgi:L-lactate permease